MSVPYEKIVAEDLNLGVGTVNVSMPAGGTAVGNKVNLGTFPALAFAASRVTTQSVPASTQTIVQLNVEDLDEGGWYNPSTYVFVPQIAGAYLIIAQVTMEALTGLLTVGIYRNGVAVALSDSARSAGVATVQVSGIVSLDGSVDEVSLRVTHTNSSAVNVGAANMSGILLGNL